MWYHVLFQWNKILYVLSRAVWIYQNINHHYLIDIDPYSKFRLILCGWILYELLLRNTINIDIVINWIDHIYQYKKNIKKIDEKESFSFRILYISSNKSTVIRSIYIFLIRLIFHSLNYNSFFLIWINFFPRKIPGRFLYSKFYGKKGKIINKNRKCKIFIFLKKIFLA